MSSPFDEFLARLGPRFDPDLIATQLKTRDYETLLKNTTKADLAPLADAGMKPIHINMLQHAIQKARATQKDEHSPFALFFERLGPDFDPAFIAAHLQTRDYDTLLKTSSKADLSPLAKAGMKPVLVNKLFTAILEERLTQEEWGADVASTNASEGRVDDGDSELESLREEHKDATVDALFVSGEETTLALGAAPMTHTDEPKDKAVLVEETATLLGEEPCNIEKEAVFPETPDLPMLPQPELAAAPQLPAIPAPQPSPAHAFQQPAVAMPQFFQQSYDANPCLGAVYPGMRYHAAVFPGLVYPGLVYSTIVYPWTVNPGTMYPGTSYHGMDSSMVQPVCSQAFCGQMCFTQAAVTQCSAANATKAHAVTQGSSNSSNDGSWSSISEVASAAGQNNRGEDGHQLKNCKPLQSEREARKCWVCGEPGHLARACTKARRPQEHAVPCQREVFEKKPTSHRQMFTVKVSNTWDVCHEDLREHLEPFGKVMRVVLRGGSAWVSFSTRHEAQSAIDGMDRSAINHSIVRVNWVD